MNKLPTYQELATLLIELTEKNIANIGSNGEFPHPHTFVCCHTYGKEIPNHWRKAIKYRHLLLQNHINN
jgi:hypothetical protein